MSVVKEKYEIFFNSDRNLDSTNLYLSSIKVLIVFLLGTLYKGFNLLTIFLKPFPSIVENALLSLHKKYAIASVMDLCCVPPAKKLYLIRQGIITIPPTKKVVTQFLLFLSYNCIVLKSFSKNLKIYSQYTIG